MVSLKRELYTELTETQLRGCREIQPYFECRHHGVMFTKLKEMKYRIFRDVEQFITMLYRTFTFLFSKNGAKHIKMNSQQHLYV